MKKAVIVKPSLLAEIKRESPAVYEYYNNSFLTRHEFIDYGFEHEPMFMRLDVYFMIANHLNTIHLDISGDMDMLQAGYLAGKNDLIKEISKHSVDEYFSKTANCLLRIATRENYLPDSERCDLINNEGRVFNKGTYCDGIYFEAWSQLFFAHALHNDVFKQINSRSKKFNLDYDNKPDFGYPLN